MEISTRNASCLFGLKKLILALLIAIISFSSFAQVTVAGCTGAENGIYANLTAAFATIVLAQPAANITISVTANTTEPGSVVIGAGNWTSLTISPPGGAARTISGNVAGHLIDLTTIVL